MLDSQRYVSMGLLDRERARQGEHCHEILATLATREMLHRPAGTTNNGVPHFFRFVPTSDLWREFRAHGYKPFNRIPEVPAGERKVSPATSDSVVQLFVLVVPLNF